jgi:hypothetical protein
MVVYNRRKRAIYFQDQELEQAKILQLARDAVASGAASPAQVALVEGIKEEEEAMEKKKAERKAPSKLLWWLHGDWKEEKELSDQRKSVLQELKEEQKKKELDLGITQAVQDARANVSGQPSVGGPLDQAAANAASSAEKAGKGWLGWAFGGSKKSE